MLIIMDLNAILEGLITSLLTEIVEYEIRNLFRARPFSQGPLRKLSVDLINTYKRINEKYYARKRKSKQDNQPGTSGVGFTNPPSKRYFSFSKIRNIRLLKIPLF